MRISVAREHSAAASESRTAECGVDSPAGSGFAEHGIDARKHERELATA